VGFPSWYSRATRAATILVAGLAASAAGPAAAQTLDLYQGSVVGSPRIVAMGGTVAAVSEDVTGTLATPAAIAFRPPGSSGSWDWDFYLDSLVASRATDLTNSGLPGSPDRAVQAYAGGICLYAGKWGVGLSAAGVSFGLPAMTAGTPAAELNAGGSQLTVARSLFDGAVGAGLSFTVTELALNQGDASLFDVTSASFAAGATWRPRPWPWRIGLSGLLPPLTTTMTNNCADAANCNGLTPPTGTRQPWQLGVGFARRFGGGAWNDPNPVLFRDERALIVAADVAIVGAVADGMSVAGFAAAMPQVSGRGADLLARVGAEGEVLPGRLRVRAGSYWEPARIDGRNGRVHGTLGAELRLFRFTLWEKERRVRLALAIDLADRYQNVALSLGFWH
jgi:hypothetical protein